MSDFPWLMFFLLILHLLKLFIFTNVCFASMRSIRRLAIIKAFYEIKWPTLVSTISLFIMFLEMDQLSHGFVRNINVFDDLIWCGIDIITGFCLVHYIELRMIQHDIASGQYFDRLLETLGMYDRYR